MFVFCPSIINNKQWNVCMCYVGWLIVGYQLRHIWMTHSFKGKKRKEKKEKKRRMTDINSTHIYLMKYIRGSWQ